MSKRLAYTIGSLYDLEGAIRAVSLPDGGTVLDGDGKPPKPPKPPKLINGDGYPAGVTPTAKAWTEDQRYRLQSGDTLSGIARTFLLDPARWREIWAVQETSVKTGKSPDNLPAGFVLEMPEEAKAMARKLGVLGMDPTTKRNLMIAGGVVGALTVGVVAVKVLSPSSGRKRR